MTTPTLSDSRRDPFNANAISWRPLTQDCIVAEFDQLPGIYGIELVDQPNPAVGVTIAGYTEIFTGAPNAGEFIVDYAGRLVRFNIADDAAAVTAVFEGKGSPVSVKHLPNLTTKGDILSHTGTALARLPVGSNGQVLKADSTQPTGLTWGAGGGGGTAGKNYITNPDGESDAANWTNGTNISVSRTTTAGEVLRGTGSIKISANGSVLAGAYVYASMGALDLADRNRMLSIEFEFKSGTGYDHGDCELRLYDGSVEIAPSIVAVPGGQGKFIATFVSTDSSSAYQLRFKSTVASAWDLIVDDLAAGPGFVMPGASITEWEYFTPVFSGLGTVTGISMQRRRVGTNMEIKGRLTTGTVTGSAPTMTIGGESIATDNAVAFKTGYGVVRRLTSGSISVFDGGYTMDGVYNGSSTAIQFCASTQSGAYANAAASSVVGSNEEIDIVLLSIPIANWDSSVVSSSSRSEHASNSSTSNADDTTSFVYGQDGALVPTGLTGHRRKRIRFKNPMQPGELVQLWVNKSGRGWAEIGSTEYQKEYNAAYYGMALEPVSGSSTDWDVIFYSAGVDMSAGSSTWTTENANGTRYKVVKCMNPLAVETGSKGYLAATSSTKTPGASGDYLAMTGSALVLLPGEWGLKGMVRYRDNGSGPGYTQEEQGWYAANGADSGSEPAALSTVCEVQAGSGARSIAYMNSVCDVQMEETRVRVAATTTVYLVPRPSLSSPANARITTYLYAERIS